MKQSLGQKVRRLERVGSSEDDGEDVSGLRYGLLVSESACG